MENPKCGICKHHWKPEDTDMKSSGLYLKCCKTCRNKQKQYRDDRRRGIFLDLNEQEANDKKEKNREYKKQYRNANMEQISQHHKRYRKKNVEYLRNYHQKYRKDNHEKLLENSRRWNNKEKTREYKKH